MKPKAAKKAAKRVSEAKRKRGPQPDPASERMAFRLTKEEKAHLHTLAVSERRTDSNYIREIVIKHLQENPPPE